ncbi:Lamin-1 [Toxocara canis]|uniref:Lamin-1 n=1 Tax=Toxocara canis TaxID=6265 RepID=A0A0B2VV90_TOXCA|nr:Lamin-1 [Toxocara canis]
MAVSVCNRYTVFVVILICCCYLITNHFGASFVNEGVGYAKGNRARMVAVLKLELTMALFSMFTYLRLMSFMDANEELSLREKRLHAHSSGQAWRFAASVGIITWLLLAQMAYPLYWAGHALQSALFTVSLISVGVWNHLVVILFGLFCVSVFISLLNSFVVQRFMCAELCGKTWVRFPAASPTDPQQADHQAFRKWSEQSCVGMEQIFFVNDLPHEAEGIRFALVSDIHAGATVGEEQIAKVVDRVNSENVDAVFLVGDMVDSPRSDIWHRLRPLKYLRSRFGSFYVTGNHEYYYGNALDWIVQFKAFGIRVLDNRSLNVSGICIAGVNDYSSGRSGIEGHRFDAVRALQKCDQTAPVVVLSHNPASAKEIAFNSENLRADLILSGHTHTGQFYTIAPLAFLILPYFYGVYQISPTSQLFVSAGTLYQGPPMKMLAMSQIWEAQMSILAGPRRKQRISVDPQNLQWRNDEAKFGRKMLERMGWRNGRGLGKREQGTKGNLKLNANYSGKGLGSKNSCDDTWVAHHDDFANLLALLNKKRDGTNENTLQEAKVIAEKSKKSRLRIRYKRFMRGSDLSEYTEEDKFAVLGMKRRNNVEEDVNNESLTDGKSPRLDEGNVIHSALSVNEYFAEKMRKLRSMESQEESVFTGKIPMSAKQRQRSSARTVVTSSSSSRTEYPITVSTDEGSESFSISMMSPNRQTRLLEKETLSNLNDRLAVYIDRVRQLEMENARLNVRINESEVVEKKEREDLVARYETKIKELRDFMDEALKDKTRLNMDAKTALAERDNLRAKIGKLEKDLKQSEKSRLSVESLIQDLQARVNSADNMRRHLEDENKGLAAENAELKRQLEVLRKQVEDEAILNTALHNQNQSLKEDYEFLKKTHEGQLEEIHRKRQVEMTTTAREIERTYESRLQEQLQAMRAEFDARLNKNRRDIDETYKNKMNEANEARQQANQAREESARLRLRIHELEKSAGAHDSRVDALNKKITDLENQLRFVRDDADVRLQQRDSRIAELQQEIDRILSEYQDLFELKVQLDTELRAYQSLLEGEESRLNISQQSSVSSAGLGGAGGAGSSSLTTLSSSQLTGSPRRSAIKRKRFIASDNSSFFRNTAKAASF